MSQASDTQWLLAEREERVEGQQQFLGWPDWSINSSPGSVEVREGQRAGVVRRSAGREQKVWDRNNVSERVFCSYLRICFFLFVDVLDRKELKKRWVTASYFLDTHTHSHTLSLSLSLTHTDVNFLRWTHRCSVIYMWLQTTSIFFSVSSLLLIQTDVFRGKYSCMTSEVTCSH